MALTGNTVQSTYLDLVQLEKSGAGLPSHAGKEAALYDGSGAQILGRTAVRHWLDPHPDAAAFAETWEFSTKGTMTQGQLEAAGWTFFNCTAEVTQGIMWLTTSMTSSNYCDAILSTNLSGDFDIVTCFVHNYEYDAKKGSTYDAAGYLAVAEGDAGSGECQNVGFMNVNGTSRSKIYHGGTWRGAAGTAVDDAVQSSSPPLIRITRSSSDLVFCGGNTMGGSRMIFPTTAIGLDWDVTKITNSTTFNKLMIKPCIAALNVVGFKTGVLFLRRFK